MSDIIQRRYDFSLFFDVENGNPNGDPDAGNMPRTDPETSLGIVSDVCLKRKVRNYVDLVKNEPVAEFKDGTSLAGSGNVDSLGYKIFIQEKIRLNELIDAGFKYHKTVDTSEMDDKEEKKAVAKFMCDNFFDIRTFGAVMTTGKDCGQIRGPIQLCFARSIDPILPLDMTNTRKAVTREDSKKDAGTFAHKQYVPYGLYRVNGFISASLAEKTGFSQADLDLFFEALMNMFENDRSAARGLMTSRKLYVFEHESKLGNAPAHALFDTVMARRVSDGPARAYSDYEIVADKSAVPEGVTLREYDWIAPSA